MGGFFEINHDEVSEELKSALREKYAGQLVRNRNLEPHTLAAENDAARVFNSRFLIEHGIEPTDENLEKLYQEANERIAVLQAGLQKDPSQKEEEQFAAKDQINVIEMNGERKLNRITKILLDKISPIEDKIEKACLLVQEMLEGYFEVLDKGEEGAQMRIYFDFPRYGTVAEMAGDYVFALREEIQALNEYVEQYYKVPNEENKGVDVQ